MAKGYSSSSAVAEPPSSGAQTSLGGLASIIGNYQANTGVLQMGATAQDIMDKSIDYCCPGHESGTHDHASDNGTVQGLGNYQGAEQHIGVQSPNLEHVTFQGTKGYAPDQGTTTDLQSETKGYNSDTSQDVAPTSGFSFAGLDAFKQKAESFQAEQSYDSTNLSAADVVLNNDNYCCPGHESGTHDHAVDTGSIEGLEMYQGPEQSQSTQEATNQIPIGIESQVASYDNTSPTVSNENASQSNVQEVANQMYDGSNAAEPISQILSDTPSKIFEVRVGLDPQTSAVTEGSSSKYAAAEFSSQDQGLTSHTDLGQSTKDSAADYSTQDVQVSDFSDSVTINTQEPLNVTYDSDKSASNTVSDVRGAVNVQNNFSEQSSFETLDSSVNLQYENTTAEQPALTAESTIEYSSSPAESTSIRLDNLDQAIEQHTQEISTDAADLANPIQSIVDYQSTSHVDAEPTTSGLDQFVQTYDSSQLRVESHQVADTTIEPQSLYESGSEINESLGVVTDNSIESIQYQSNHQDSLSDLPSTEGTFTHNTFTESNSVHLDDVSSELSQQYQNSTPENQNESSGQELNESSKVEYANNQEADDLSIEARSVLENNGSIEDITGTANTTNTPVQNNSVQYQTNEVATTEQTSQTLPHAQYQSAGIETVTQELSTHYEQSNTAQVRHEYQRNSVSEADGISHSYDSQDSLEKVNYQSKPIQLTEEEEEEEEKVSSSKKTKNTNSKTPKKEKKIK